MKKRVVITGGTGFIGAALCAELEAAGYDIVVLSVERGPVFPEYAGSAGTRADRRAGDTRSTGPSRS